MSPQVISIDLLADRLATDPQAAADAIDTLWHMGACVSGSLDLLGNSLRDGGLSLTQTMKLIAMTTDPDPESAAHLIATSAPALPGDMAALQAAAASALSSPATLRCMTAPAAMVAG